MPLTPNSIDIGRCFDRAAARYDQYAELQRYAARSLFDLCRPKFTPQEKVLDAGCGTGYFHELARKNRLYFPLYQLDIAQGMCQVARAYGSTPPYGETYTLNADAQALPMANEAFRVVFSSLMLQWLPDPRQFFQEAFRVLKPGGMLAVATLGPKTLQELREAFAAIGREASVNQFVHSERLMQYIHSTGFSSIIASEESHMRQYPSVQQLLHEMKGLGANYKLAPNVYPFMGKSGLQALEKNYQEKATHQAMLPATWEILYIMAVKP